MAIVPLRCSAVIAQRSALIVQFTSGAFNCSLQIVTATSHPLPSPYSSPSMPAPSTSKVTIDDARNILCIRGTSSIDSSRSMWLDSSPREYKLYCSESYLSWLVKTDPRHMGLLQHVLNELKHVITTNDLASKELIGNFLINPYVLILTSVMKGGELFLTRPANRTGNFSRQLRTPSRNRPTS